MIYRLIVTILILVVAGCSTLNVLLNIDAIRDPQYKKNNMQDIFVVKNENVENQIIENEFYRKIHKVLKAKGYHLTFDPKSAKFILLYYYEIKEGRNITSSKTTGKSTKYGIGNLYYNQLINKFQSKSINLINFSGQTKTESYNLDKKILKVDIYDAKKYRKYKKASLVWSGKIISEDRISTRASINYLLYGLYKHIGNDYINTLNMSIAHENNNVNKIKNIKANDIISIENSEYDRKAIKKIMVYILQDDIEKQIKYEKVFYKDLQKYGVRKTMKSNHFQISEAYSELEITRKLNNIEVDTILFVFPEKYKVPYPEATDKNMLSKLINIERDKTNTAYEDSDVQDIQCMLIDVNTYNVLYYSKLPNLEDALIGKNTILESIDKSIKIGEDAGH